MEKIGKYEIIEELGKGAMGVVFRALDPDIKREVAVKTIRFELITEGPDKEEYMQRFMNEAKAAGRLSHPNIITIYDVGKTDDLTYIVMQLIEGESLKEMIDEKKQLSPHEIIDLMASLCDALDYAHKKGIVHRDMKPGNIIMEKSKKPFILDFGVARMEASTMTQTGQTLGTPSYMSPEQVMGQKIDGRSDIFSLGVILYELLTGHRPFSAEGGITTLIYKIVNEKPVPISKFKKNVSPKFETIIAKALAKSPDDRFQNCHELAKELHPLKGVPEKTLTLKLSKEDLLAKGKKKKPKLGLILGIALSAAVIIGGGSFYFLTQKGGGSSEQGGNKQVEPEKQDPQKAGVIPGKPGTIKGTQSEVTKPGKTPSTKKPATSTNKTSQQKPKETITQPKTKSTDVKKPTEKPKTDPEKAKPKVDKLKTPAVASDKPKEVKPKEPGIKTARPDPFEAQLKAMKDSFMQENFKETRRIAGIILDKDPGSLTAKNYLDRANKKIQIGQQIEAAISSYGAGNYAQCIQITNGILKLDPGNKQAEQYLNLAKTRLTEADDTAIRLIISRQKKAEEEENMSLLESDYTQSMKDMRRDDVIDLFNFYDNIKSNITNISIKYTNGNHAEIRFHQVLDGVSKNTGIQTIIFEDWRTLTFERQGKIWKIIDYK